MLKHSALNELLQKRLELGLKIEKDDIREQVRDNLIKKEAKYMLEERDDSYQKALNFKRHQQDYPGYEQPETVN